MSGTSNGQKGLLIMGGSSGIGNLAVDGGILLGS